MATYSNLLESENPSSLHADNELLETVLSYDQDHLSQQQNTLNVEEISMTLSQTIDHTANAENLNEFSFLSTSTTTTTNSSSNNGEGSSSSLNLFDSIPMSPSLLELLDSYEQITQEPQSIMNMSNTSADNMLLNDLLASPVTNNTPNHIDIMNAIREYFDSKVKIRYVCISKNKQSTSSKNTTMVQIILKEKITESTWFLDGITKDTRCNYQVTTKTRAWNEYIKKNGDYIEFGRFKSPTDKGKLTWINCSFVCYQRQHNNAHVEAIIPADHLSENEPVEQQVVNEPILYTVPSQEDIILAHAFFIAKTDIHRAMAYVQKHIPHLFALNCLSYLDAFKYTNNQEQQHRSSHSTSS